METKTTGEREGIFSKVMSTLSYHPKLMESLKGYNMTMLKSDMMAGLVVGIVSLPLGIAFGIASGVTPEQGLITSIIAGVIISLFGGTRVQIGGSTGTFVVVIYGVVQEFGPIGMFLATFLAGVFLLLFGVLKLGTVIKYIPYPIVVGFTGGIAMSILSTQIKDFLGLSIEGKLPNDFIEKWIVCFQNIGTINWWSFGAGLLSLFIIFVGPKFIKKVPGSLLAILLVTTLVFLLKKFLGINGIETIGDRFSINGSLSSTEFPQISWGNLKGVVTPAFTIAMLGAIESLLSATIADGVTGNKHDSNTELIAQGLANIVTPFFGGVPATGVVARTMINVNNGGRTPIAGVFHALVLVVIFFFLMPLAEYIPIPCLAAVLLSVAYNMFGWRSFKILLTNPKEDVIVLFITFTLSMIFDLSVAVEVGIVMACFLFMSRMMKSTDIKLLSHDIDENKENGEDSSLFIDKLNVPDGVEVYEINGPMFFGMGNRFEEVMNSISSKKPYVRILLMNKVPFIDATGLGNLFTMCQMSKTSGVRIILSGVNTNVFETIKKAPTVYNLVEEHFICKDIHQALEVAEEVKNNFVELGWRK